MKKQRIEKRNSDTIDRMSNVSSQLPVHFVAVEARKCRECEQKLPLGPRPIFRINSNAVILIASQAPGRIAHESGVPFQDPSGKRLRQWMGITEKDFFDDNKIAVIPMGLCYPGKADYGDHPPMKQCAPLWRERLLGTMPNIALTLAIGHHAQSWHLGERTKTVTERVKNWDRHGGLTVPLPHPSPVNNRWITANPWFEVSVLPKLRQQVARCLR